jgi:hypothetical protein
MFPGGGWPSAPGCLAFGGGIAPNFRIIDDASRFSRIPIPYRAINSDNFEVFSELTVE